MVAGEAACGGAQGLLRASAPPPPCARPPPLLLLLQSKGVIHSGRRLLWEPEGHVRQW